MTIAICLVVLSVLVFLHEGGHFIAARLFGVRVSVFMLGLPGPHIGFKAGGTKFGVTCIPLGGYARISGMEPGNMKPYLEEVLACIFREGCADAAKVASICGIRETQAQDALEELVEWGSVSEPTKSEDQNLFFAAAINGYERGQARPVDDQRKTFEDEFCCQYRSLGFIKRSIIVLAGIFVNVLFAILVFVILYSLIGVDIKHTDTGEIEHIFLQPLQSLQYGAMYIGAVCNAVINLFNPATAAETVSNSTSVIGIAVLSKTAAEQGFWTLLEFMAMISVSLGIMNLLPIPPLDGGKFLVEIIQFITRRNVSEKVITRISFVGFALLIIFFIFMLQQDIVRFILGAG